MSQLAVGYFVPRTHNHCTRCGDQNYDESTRECLTCTYPDAPASLAYLRGRHADVDPGWH